MNAYTTLSRSLGLAAAATLAAGIYAVGPADAAANRFASATASGDTLTILGTARADKVVLDFSDPAAVVVDFADGRTPQRFERGTLARAVVLTGSGDDDVRVVSGGPAVDLPLTIAAGFGDDSVVGGGAADTLYGGNGDDHLLGGLGVDTVAGGSGDDEVNGQGGIDTEFLGAGDDTAVWNPGDSNDTVVGGTGDDLLVFNGSGADEVMSLSASGGTAVFLRSPGAIRMDLTGVERVHTNALGGADSITVADLTGTAVRTSEVDLGALGGGGDAKADAVVVLGTDRADTVGVITQNDAIDVAGLRARTVVTGAEPTDTLRLELRGGHDVVDVADEVAALINLVVDLGAGQL
jgi:hypothetical protein